MKELRCESVDDQDLIGLYLAGRLSEPDSERLEEHAMGCAACAAVLERGADLRRAFGERLFSAPEPAPVRIGRDLWTLAAAAAAVVVMAVGIVQVSGRPEPATPEVLRGGTAGTFDFTVSAAGNGQVLVTWLRVPAASTYRIEIIRSDGEPVLTSETADDRVEINVGALPPRPSGSTLLAKVQGRNALGQVVAETPFKDLRVD